MKQKNQSPKRKPFTEPLTDEEQEQIRKRAHAIWRARKDDGKTSAADDWSEAIEQLKAERGLPGGARKAGKWVWQHTGFKGKTLWDFLQLLVVPLTLALVGFGLQDFAKQREQQIADDKAKQDTLVEYLDQMADSLNAGLLKEKPGSEKFIIAQARTVTALQSLDRKRQHLIIQFLRASGLSKTSDQTTAEKLADQDRVLLYQAQMEKATLINSDLSGAVFIQANLKGANFNCDLRENESEILCSDLSSADFRGASLRNANLRNTDLNNANLRNTGLSNTDLRNANLFNADLFNADLFNAKLRDANLVAANLSAANLFSADLSAANLDIANLRDANLGNTIVLATNLSAAQNLTKEQLEGAFPPYLCKAKLPSTITVEPNRDCEQLPQRLMKLYPGEFKTPEEAQKFIDKYK